MEELVAWIHQELHVRGWSQRELAKRAKISTGALSMVINEQRGAGPEFCKAIARVFQVPPEQVFRLAGLLPKLSIEEEMRREILYYYDQMSADTQRHFRILARALAESTGDYEIQSSEKQNPE